MPFAKTSIKPIDFLLGLINARKAGRSFSSKGEKKTIKLRAISSLFIYLISARNGPFPLSVYFPKLVPDTECVFKSL